MIPLTRAASSTFHVVTHVWGREYLEVFLNTCIPNQLAPGNVPALPPGSRYRILTSSAHVEELQGHPMVRALRDVIPVDVLVIDDLDQRRGTAIGHELMIACHRRAIDDILAEDAAIIMLSADFVLSDNALAAVVKRHAEGYRAVVNTGLRLAKESFLRMLDESRAPLASLSSRELVRMALPHLHPHTQSMFADEPRFSTSPVAVYWRVANQGLLARCLHLHPLMVDPMRQLPLLVGTNDGPYVAQACPDFSRVHVVTDSDELQMFELTSVKREVVKTSGSGISVWSAAIMAAKGDELQRSYWQRHPIRIHAVEPGEEWTAADVIAERFVRRVMRRRRYAKLARRWFRWVGDMRKRRGRYSKALHRQRRRLRLDGVRRWRERQLRSWERRRPRIRVRQIQRPVKLFVHRSAKTIRKTMLRTSRRVFRQVGAR